MILWYIVFFNFSEMLVIQLSEEKTPTNFRTLWQKERKGNVLFNDTLNTFYFYGYMVEEGTVLFNDALNIFYF